MGIGVLGLQLSHLVAIFGDDVGVIGLGCAVASVYLSAQHGPAERAEGLVRQHATSLPAISLLESVLTYLERGCVFAIVFALVLPR